MNSNQSISFHGHRGDLLTDLHIKCVTNGTRLDFLSKVKKVLDQHHISYRVDTLKQTLQKEVYDIRLSDDLPSDVYNAIIELAELARNTTSSYSRQFDANTTPAFC